MTPALPDRLLADLADACGVPDGACVAVGVSGGADSVTLLRVLAEAGRDVAVLHVDHALRDASADDAAFVAALAAELDLPLRTRRVTVGAGNRADAARRARYAALGAMAREVGAVAVAVAHTATDQAETVLMALVRGAGLTGLGGMAPRRALDTESPPVALVRPMLSIARAEVEAFARARGWTWRDDPSNATGLRGRLRRDVLPVLDAIGGPATAQRIAASARAARAARPAAMTDAFVDAEGRVRLALGDLPADVRKLVWAEAVARHAPAARRSAALLSRLDALLDAPVGRRVAASGVEARRNREAVVIRPAD